MLFYSKITAIVGVNLDRLSRLWSTTRSGYKVFASCSNKKALAELDHYVAAGRLYAVIVETEERMIEQTGGQIQYDESDGWWVVWSDYTSELFRNYVLGVRYAIARYIQYLQAKNKEKQDRIDWLEKQLGDITYQNSVR